MKLKALEINKKFIPVWNGNKEQPLDEQVVIIFNRIPGSSEKGNYKGFKFSQGGSIELSYNDNLMCSSFIQKIQNLDINEKKIKDGKDLATANHPKIADLITEIRDYLFPDEDFEEGESGA